MDAVHGRTTTGALQSLEQSLRGSSSDTIYAPGAREVFQGDRQRGHQQFRRRERLFQPLHQWGAAERGPARRERNPGRRAGRAGPSLRSHTVFSFIISIWQQVSSTTCNLDLAFATTPLHQRSTEPLPFSPCACHAEEDAARCPICLEAFWKLSRAGLIRVSFISRPRWPLPGH